MRCFCPPENSCGKRARTSGGRPTRWMIAATFAIALATFPWNAGASTFFVYTAAFLPFSIEATGWVLAFFSLEAAAVVAESRIFHLPWQSAAFAIFLLLVIGGGNIFFAQQRRADCKLRAAQEENVALAARVAAAQPDGPAPVGGDRLLERHRLAVAGPGDEQNGAGAERVPDAARKRRTGDPARGGDWHESRFLRARGRVNDSFNARPYGRAS